MVCAYPIVAAMCLNFEAVGGCKNIPLLNHDAPDCDVVNELFSYSWCLKLYKIAELITEARIAHRLPTSNDGQNNILPNRSQSN